jgi:hypothetical protein
MKNNYVHRFSFYLRPIYKLTVFIQWVLWKNNIHWHNSIFNECTPDFSCCINKYPVGSNERFILGQIANGAMHKEPIIHINLPLDKIE